MFMCGVAQHTEDTPGRSRQGLTPSNDVVALQNEQVVYVPNKNYRNPSKGGQTSMRKTERLLHSHGGIGWAGG